MGKQLRYCDYNKQDEDTSPYRLIHNKKKTSEKKRKNKNISVSKS